MIYLERMVGNSDWRKLYETITSKRILEQLVSVSRDWIIWLNCSLLSTNFSVLKRRKFLHELCIDFPTLNCAVSSSSPKI
jgi:hypothetical protein